MKEDRSRASGEDRTHADRVREKEREVIESVLCCYGRHGLEDTGTVEARADELLTLRAATCPTCRGEGHAGWTVELYPNEWAPCPAGCDNGRKRD